MAEGRRRLLCRPSGAFAIDFLFSCFLSEGPGGGAGRTASSGTGGRAVTVVGGGGGGVSVCRVFIRAHGIRARVDAREDGRPALALASTSFRKETALATTAVSFESRPVTVPRYERSSVFERSGRSASKPGLRGKITAGEKTGCDRKLNVPRTARFLVLIFFFFYLLISRR